MPPGVKRRGEEAAEPTSVKGLYEGGLRETKELLEEFEKVLERPGEERMELAELDLGEAKTRQEDGTESTEEEREDCPEGGFLEGICKERVSEQ